MLWNLSSMRDTRHTVKKTFGQWIAILAILVFLLGTAAFSFLWNVPLDKLAVPRSGSLPPAILFRTPSLPGRPIPVDPALAAAILPFLEHYAKTVTNAGHIDFSTCAPQEVEIRMEGLSISMGPSLTVFNFDTKYGFSMQTSKKPDAADQALYQWMKSMEPPDAPCPEKQETPSAPSSNETDAARSNRLSYRTGAGPNGASPRQSGTPLPEDHSTQH